MEAMNSNSKSFVIFLLVFSSVVSGDIFNTSLPIKPRSVKKDSSESDFKGSLNASEPNTNKQLLDKAAKDNLKNDTNAEIDLPVELVTTSRTTSNSPEVRSSSNISLASPTPTKPLDNSSSIIFVAIFVVGFIGVVAFYIWKRSTDSAWRVPATYQYSVLNSFENDPEDELTDHLRVGDDFIVGNDSSDDDVELLGQNSLTNHQVDGNSLLLSFGNGPNPTSVIGTVTAPTQVNGVHPSMVPTQFPNGRISSAILDDSDEELLQ